MTSHEYREILKMLRVVVQEDVKETFLASHSALRLVMLSADGAFQHIFQLLVPETRMLSARSTRTTTHSFRFPQHNTD
jgi:hypothetical protein